MNMSKLNANSGTVMGPKPAPKPVAKKPKGLSNSSFTSPSCVFTTNKATIFAGSFRARSMSAQEWALIINADGSVPKVPRITLLHGAPAWAEYTPHHYPEMVIEWADYGVPNLPRSYWEQLADGVSKIDGNVLIHCTAGRGRTGTILSILACLMDVVPATFCPVTWVRNRYDKEACETGEQLDYVEAITGRPVYAEECSNNKWPPTQSKSFSTVNAPKPAASTAAKTVPSDTSTPHAAPGRYAGGAECVGGTPYGTETAKVEILGKTVFVDTSALDDEEYAVWAYSRQLPLSFVSANIIPEEDVDDEEGVFEG